jgi:hypothetical protein
MSLHGRLVRHTTVRRSPSTTTGIRRWNSSSAAAAVTLGHDALDNHKKHHHNNDTTTTNGGSSSPTTHHQHPLYPHLFTPLDLGPAGLLPNRVLMGSMHTGLEGHSLPKWMESLFFLSSSSHHSSQEDHSLQRMAAYFEARAKGGVGLMVTGKCTSVEEGAGASGMNMFHAYYHTLFLFEPRGYVSHTHTRLSLSTRWHCPQSCRMGGTVCRPIDDRA